MKLKENYTDEEWNALLAEATYHLGRVLVLGEFDFDRAVSELEEAVQLDPDNIPARYYLGKAIQILVERDMLKRAKDAWWIYLSRGAMLGYEDEVRKFLGLRMAK